MSELTQQDRDDLRAIGIEPDAANEPTPRSLLESWEAVLGNIERSADGEIPINVALKVIGTWPFLSIADTAVYHRVYHDILLEGRDRFASALRKHPEAKSFVGDDDAANNHEVYLEILVLWHTMLDGFEASWKATDQDAAVWVAAIADARGFFFSRDGLAGHLDVIGFRVEDDEFVDAVTEYLKGDESEAVEGE